MSRSDAWLLARVSGAKQEAPELGPADRRVSEAMMRMWTQFARTGSPNGEGLPAWQPFSATQPYLYISDPSELRSGFGNLVP